MDERPFTEIEHTADWALEVRGDTLADLCAHAAEGMLQLMGAEAAPGAARAVRIRLKSPDAESMLVAWLEELLFRMERSPVTFSNFHPRVDDAFRLDARLRQHPRQDLKKSIKAVTFHNLKVERGDGGWKTVIVFDV